MGHPLIEEFCRIKSLGTFRLTRFRHMQRTFRSEINPLLEAAAHLTDEIAALKIQHAKELQELQEAIDVLTAKLAAQKPRVGRPPITRVQ